MAEQLIMDLQMRPALGRDDFFISSANAVAIASVDNWRSWPAGKLVLVGEPGSGKTHLAHVWARDSGARIVEAAALGRDDPVRLSEGPFAIEDVDRICGDDASERALFHLHNLMLAAGEPLLLTARTAPSAWALTLPDLASRMQGTPIAMLEPPDDALLGAVMLKLFADRQLEVAPTLLPYLIQRIDRSFDSAREVVERLDRAALREGRAVTRRLASAVLDI